MSVLIENENKVEFEPQNMIKIFLLRLNIHLFTKANCVFHGKSKGNIYSLDSENTVGFHKNTNSQNI